MTLAKLNLHNHLHRSINSETLLLFFCYIGVIPAALRSYFWSLLRDHETPRTEPGSTACKARPLPHTTTIALASPQGVIALASPQGVFIFCFVRGRDIDP